MNNDISGNAQLWKQRGSIIFWKYLENSRNYPDWNLSLCPIAQKSLTDLIQRLVGGTEQCKRTIAVEFPPCSVLKVPNNQAGSGNVSSPKKICLFYDPHLVDCWDIDHREDAVIWQIGRVHALALLTILEAPEKYFDQSFGSESHLWWWGVTE